MARRLVRKSKKYPIFGLTGPLYMNFYATRFKQNVSVRYYCLCGKCLNRHSPDAPSNQFRSSPNRPDQGTADRATGRLAQVGAHGGDEDPSDRHQTCRSNQGHHRVRGKQAVHHWKSSGNHETLDSGRNSAISDSPSGFVVDLASRCLQHIGFYTPNRGGQALNGKVIWQIRFE